MEAARTKGEKVWERDRKLRRSPTARISKAGWQRLRFIAAGDTNEYPIYNSKFFSSANYVLALNAISRSLTKPCAKIPARNGQEKKQTSHSRQ